MGLQLYVWTEFCPDCATQNGCVPGSDRGDTTAS